MKHTWKKAAAGLLAMALVVGAAPANVGTGGFLGGTAITANAAEYSGYVNVSQLEKGDIISVSAEYLEEGYTLTLKAGGYSDDFGDISDSDITLSDYDFWDGSFMDFNNGNRYSPYFNGESAEGWLVDSIDHNARTFTLTGYTEPDGDAVALTGDAVDYIYYNSKASQLVTAKINADKCYQVYPDDKKWEDGSWYVVTEDTVFEKRIIIEGNVHLILSDGVKLTAKKGIEVNAGTQLDIYAQSEEDSAGQLFAGTTDGRNSIMDRTPENAAIGGSAHSSNGTINIHGGIIKAASNAGAAAIGGGQDSPCGTVNIYGGDVTASVKDANYSASFGGGYRDKGGTVNVLGGTVTAYNQNQDSVPTWNVAEGASIKAGGSENDAVDVEAVGNQYYLHIELPVNVFDTTLVTGETYKQTASKDGKYYTRFVFVKPKSDIEGKSKATFTAHYNGTDYSFETTSYYTGMTSNEISYTPDSEESVLFVVTITSSSDISADLTCDIAFE